MSIYAIVLTGRIPSKKNQKQIVRNKTTGRMLILPSANHKAWQEEQMWKLKSWKNKHTNFKTLTEVKSMSVTIFAPDKIKGDLSNKVESVSDILVDAGIIEDDNWFVLPELLIKFGGVDKENPRAEIIIETKK